MKSNSKLNIFIAGIFFLTSMLILLAYSNADISFEIPSIKLKKNKELSLVFDKPKMVQHIIKPAIFDSSLKKNRQKVDTAHKRILLIGDSEIEGLRIPFYNYCKFNGHELLLSLIWYSASDYTFSSNDTLEHVIDRYKPDYIVMVIGLNQMFQNNFDESDSSIRKIVSTFKGIPYSWIGPANWVEDKGIKKVFEQNVDSGCFFLSGNLVLARAKDGRHPDKTANYIWMDSIANWMNTKAYWSIKMNKPDTVIIPKNLNLMILNASEK